MEALKAINERNRKSQIEKDRRKKIFEKIAKELKERKK